MTTTNALNGLKELLALQTEKLETLRKNKLITSAQVMEKKIEETKKAIERHAKKQRST